MLKSFNRWGLPAPAFLIFWGWMNIAKANGPTAAAAGVQTEWRQNVNQKDTPKEVPGESFGTQLNRMSGIAADDKNVFQKKNELNKESYLKMLMEQLKFQDPFNPVKNEQFSQQMTALSQLEQQISTNKSLEKMVAAQSNQQIAALQLVGKNILADRASIFHDRDKPSTVNFKLPQDASDVKLEIFDTAGTKVRSLDVGARNLGDVSTKWDGGRDDGTLADPGKYTFKVQATSMDNKPMEIATKIDGRVTGVTSSQGVTFLLVGEQRVALNEIETIKEGVADAATGSTAAPAANVPPTDGNTAGTKNESVKSDVAKMATPDVSVTQDAAKSLAEDPMETKYMSEIMPVFVR